MIDTFRSLKGLDISDYGSGVAAPFLQVIGHNLHFLRLSYIDERAMTVLKDADLANLKELAFGECCSFPSMETFKRILRTASNVERVFISQHTEDIDYKQDLIQLIQKCHRLNVFIVDLPYYINEMLDAVIKALQQMRERQRNTFRMEISGVCPDVTELDEYILKLQQIIDSLSICNLNHWMLFCEPYENDDVRWDHTFLNRLQATLTENKVQIVQEETQVFVITDSNCTYSAFNGCMESSLWEF